jgi:hypothetical protein
MQRVFLVLLFALLAGGLSTPSAAQAGPSLSLTKKVVVTTDAEGGSARPEIAVTADRVFVVYLGHIRQGNSRTFDVKIFDRNLDTLVASKTLVTTTTDYGGPTDIRIASDSQYLYAFYETHKTTSQTTAINYLWGAKYRLDDNFDRVAYTPTPTTSSKPMAELQDGGELLDDPAPLIGPSSVFVVTRLKYSLAKAGKTAYRVREFNKADLTPLSAFDLDLSDVADGRARVTSLLFWDGGILIALATTVSDQGIQEGTDDGAQSDVVLVSLKPDWTYDPQKDVRSLTAEPGDRENYITGLKTDGNYFYLTYKQSVGTPPSGEHRAIIKVFDQAFNLLQKEQVKSTVWGAGGGEIRPSLEVRGNNIFSGQSSGQGIGTGNAEVCVYETTLPLLVLRVNGDLSSTITIGNPVTVDYTIRGGAGQEFFLALDAPAMGIPWAYRTAAGTWVPLPANLNDVTPFTNAPADGDYTLYSGTVPPGTYTLCLGYDTVMNGHLDLTAAMYDCVTVTVQ